MIRQGLSLDPRGELSGNAAERILAIIQPEARALGFEFRKVGVACVAAEERRYLLIAYCPRHKIPIAPNSACEVCLLEARI